jgi:hypothetical protein
MYAAMFNIELHTVVTPCLNVRKLAKGDENSEINV